MHTLSIVIPTFNRLPLLQRVLAGLAAQRVAQDTFDVVVVADGTTDGTEEFLRTAAYPFTLHAICQENAGVAMARNRGIDAATGDLVLFLDDDVVPAPHLVQTHLAAHAEYGPNTVVLGPMITPPDVVLRPWVDWEQRMLQKQYDDMAAGKYAPTARQFFTGNTSLGRRHLVAQGGFDVRFRRAEDVELAYRLARAGLSFVFKGDAVGYHYADRSFAAWLATPYAYGKNDVIFWRELGCDWLLPTVWREFHQRHRLIRAVTTLCLDRPRLSKAMATSLRQGAAALPKQGRFAYSALFNLRYYQGVADELGGRKAFFAGVTRAAPHRAAQPTEDGKLSTQKS
jgi:GT2 family glycosyltransferase